MCKLYSLNRFILFIMGLLLVQQLAASPGPLRDSLPPDSLAPDITSFTPKAARKGETVFIFGKNFRGARVVSFGGVRAASFVVFADSGIRAVVGNGASGAVGVTTRFGSDKMDGFKFIRDTLPPDSLKPDIRSFNPASAGKGAFVFIFGKNFKGAQSVSFGGVPASSFVVFADSGIRATVGPGASGFVRVTTPFGTDSLGGFTFIKDTITPCPDIESFTPTSGTTGTQVDIFGQHFLGTTSVRFGGVPAASFTVISDSLIYATVGSGATGFVSVSKPFCTDSLGGFTFIRDTITPCPDIEFFSPTSGATGTHVDIVGRHFFGTTSVNFGGVPASSFTVISDSLIYATVGSGASGSVQVKKEFCADSLGGFTFIRDTIPGDTLCPNIVFFSPTFGTTGTNVNIIGDHFFGTSSVSFGGVPAASFTVISDSLIYATVGNGATGFIRVSKPFCSDSIGIFTYVRDTIPVDTLCPDITSFSPTSAREGAFVFIVGQHFVGTSSVSFGGVPVIAFQVINDSLIYATVGNGASGFVRVSKPFCTDSLGGFTFIRDTIPSDSSKPDILSFFPKKGSTGTIVTIFGQHFNNASIVSFGGVPASTFQVFSDSVIRATVGVGATGAVAVKTPNGWDSLGTFVYVVKDSSYTINVAPNPARTYTIVTHPALNQPTQLKLADVTGNVVRVIQVGANTTQTRLNLTGVRPGVYKLGWSNGQKWYTKTILVE